MSKYRDMAVKVPAEEKKRLSDFYEFLYSFIHEHHDNEEKIFFPMIRERFAAQGGTMPEKCSLDHPKLLQVMDDIRTEMKHHVQKSSLEDDDRWCVASSIRGDEEEVPAAGLLTLVKLGRGRGRGRGGSRQGWGWSSQRPSPYI